MIHIFKRWMGNPIHLGEFAKIAPFYNTFNGIGEYTLIESNDNFFTLQGRTKRPYITNMTELAKGTVYTAFTITKNDSETVQITLGDTTDTVSIILN